MAPLIFSRIGIFCRFDHICFSKYGLYVLNSHSLQLFCRNGSTKTHMTFKNWTVIAPVLRNLRFCEPRFTVRKLSNINPDENKKKSSENDESKSGKTMLMDVGSLIIWPNFFLTIKNFILTKLIIQPYFDREFDLKDFINGAKQALLFVSRHLSAGTLNSLEGAVAPEALLEIQKYYESLTIQQRQSLLVNMDDIFFCFPYQVGIIMEDDSKKRFTEITVVYHCLRGSKEKQEEAPVVNVKNYMICNYRFIKEFTEGVEGDWTINRLNHVYIEKT